jgi:hypothetical protein
MVLSVLLEPYTFLQKEHQGYNKEDGYYQFTREEQVTIFKFALAIKFFCISSIKPQTTISMVLIKHAGHNRLK